ncbi:RxLR effector protein [Phytophthora megakarya]|uniref:RxLR effector protein n=1 Tax=Phytophthora megakarya TaxID=4795 RepID=A0A225W1W3_9STRA|nr:RxLR effector protein [Phytophthora megakarya]
MRLGFMLFAIVTTLLVSSEARSLRKSHTESVGTTEDDPTSEERVFRRWDIGDDVAPAVAAMEKLSASTKLKDKNVVLKALAKAKANTIDKVKNHRWEHLRLEYKDGRYQRDPTYW